MSSSTLRLCTLIGVVVALLQFLSLTRTISNKQNERASRPARRLPNDVSEAPSLAKAKAADQAAAQDAANEAAAAAEESEKRAARLKASEEELCVFWASTGECEANPRYMNAKCGKECSVLARLAHREEDRPALITRFVKNLHGAFAAVRPPGFGLRNDPHRATDAKIWEIYHAAIERLLGSSEYASLRVNEAIVRKDDSVFVSISSFRDDVCPDTLENLYATASDPALISVGLVQQNCDQGQHDSFGCWSAVMPSDMRVHAIEADVDCRDAYCARANAYHGACHGGLLRVLRFNESETFGPVFGRYLGSMLWEGEAFYMQVDAHTTFARGWDAVLRDDYALAPSEKPLFSHYPPSGPQRPFLRPDGAPHAWERAPGPCMCSAAFAEYDIVRIGAMQQFPYKQFHPAGCVPSGPFDEECRRVPRHAPFVGAGFVFVRGDFISQVPFDPYLPFIFMGEELDFAARAWTAGWDTFCPPRSAVAHAYVRPQRPKFWGALQRSFGAGAHNSLQQYVLARVKHLVGYPEARHTQQLDAPSLASHFDLYGLGSQRPLSDYLRLADLDFISKKPATSKWCQAGDAPPKTPAWPPKTPAWR
ncbi:GlcNAc-domain-containing protein [Pelagophyceae sp. CCMP2097]|nr:GlcNAc-domain-containing protein [Pelagophyceae sp. CCMP2097]|mmetsp:Transcript_22726/g.76805  ORF Transcript_22726/g.76805 Transcript_22726/m.76805 type:complete len:593 (-) Transcript_22726:31-1809(-)